MGILDAGRLIFDGAPWDFVRRAEGKTWQLHLQDEQRAQLDARYTIVHRREDKTGTRLRVVSHDGPLPGAVPMHPNLEDAYVLHFQSESTDWEGR